MGRRGEKRDKAARGSENAFPSDAGGGVSSEPYPLTPPGLQPYFLLNAREKLLASP